MDIDASNMDVEWANRPDEVMEYCVRDAALPLDILHAIQAIRRKEAVAAVAKVPFETASNGSTSQLLDSLVVRLADRREVAVPLTGSAEAKEGQITEDTFTMSKQDSIHGLQFSISRACIQAL